MQHSPSAPASEEDLKLHLANVAASVETHLAAIIDNEASEGAPKRLVSAIRHAVLGSGKRFRPFLVIETASLYGVSLTDARDAAAAVELIHCYSLVHDDLPSMDNDKLRRGKPTVWTAYDEWTAILAGDALQALAFEVLARCPRSTEATRLAMVADLSRASGMAGMVGGQSLDLEAEKFADRPTADLAHILSMQAMKTGRLISVSATLGARLGGASDDERARLTRYGDLLGLAFQIGDDLIDAHGDAADAGKATQKDAKAGKATLVSLIGPDAARRKLADTVADAVTLVQPFGSKANRLIAAAHYLSNRQT